MVPPPSLPGRRRQSALQRSKELKENAWVQALLARAPRLKVAVALANKTARIAWAMMAKGNAYRREAAPAM
jgi:transposase